MGQLRIVMFGIRCHFTERVLARLGKIGQPPVALILPGPPFASEPLRVSRRSSALPVAGSSAVESESTREEYLVGSLTSAATLAMIERLEPDVFVVACFPSLIPSDLYQRASLNAVNIHPSLLPAHRGPDPLFWIMRDGGRGCGVTVHALSDRFDAGTILAQRPVSYPIGIRERALEGLLASIGADLIPDVIARLHDGSTGHEQEVQNATYESWPTQSDYVINTNRSVRSAWNFVRGIAGRGIPIHVELGHGGIDISDAVSFGGNDHPTPVEGQVVIRFTDGWILAALSPEVDD